MRGKSTLSPVHGKKPVENATFERNPTCGLLACASLEEMLSGKISP